MTFFAAHVPTLPIRIKYNMIENLREEIQPVKLFCKNEKKNKT